ncbi:hypothetical protein [Streptomyces sp. YS-3]|uniref:hypothetical protein n=1 Tax=Streptomyces sp. YS-3 TaxID=3381352 RepID=UPI0038626A28
MPENTVTAPLAPMEPENVTGAFAYIRALPHRRVVRTIRCRWCAPRTARTRCVPGPVTVSVVRAPAHHTAHRGARHRPRRTAPGARHGRVGSYITRALDRDLTESPHRI